ncbi:MAG: transcriptional regulator [Ruminococcaceae bacterium]|nr:transcriptional regulator [Oscillospiraceae bacterium]
MSDIDKPEHESRNNTAWQLLFEKYDILHHIEQDGSFQISATQIKEFREPRLMAKFDHTINLPKLFVQNKLSILPVTRGDYIISHFDAYHKFESISSDIIRVSLPYYIQSLNVDSITSEAVALNCAYVSGIMADFLEDEQLVPTVSGRMGSGIFDFEIKDTEHNSNIVVKVHNSQIEIDAGYEGLQKLALIEAKRDLSDDFLVRQLYYPFRTWTERVNKAVKPIFLVYSNGIFHLYEYQFANPMEYSSIMLVKQKNYTVEEDMTITTEEISQLLDTVQIVKEPDIAFPQADSFNRVINLCELLLGHPMTREEITINYAFNVRQTNYYTDAARYLGLIDKQRNNDITFTLTSKGRDILRLSYKQRQLAFCEAVLSHKVFADSLRLWFKQGEINNQDIVATMKQNYLYNVESESTYIRRASTIKGWLEWIVGLL